MIVEIAFSLGDSKFSRQDGCCEIFGAGFAVASGDRENFDQERASIIRSEVLKGAQSIFCSDNREFVRQFRVIGSVRYADRAPRRGVRTFPAEIDNRAEGTRFCGGFNELVAVEILTAQGDKELAAF